MRHTSTVVATMKLDQPVVPDVGRCRPRPADLNLFWLKVCPEAPVAMTDGALAPIERLLRSWKGDLDGLAVAGQGKCWSFGNGHLEL